MKIPLVKLSNQFVNKKILHSIKEIIDSGEFILGKNIKKFEKEFATYVGTKYCIGVASGADALVLSLSALEIGRGNEVIVPSMTFMATASAVMQVGATPVFVDILSDLPIIDTSKIEEKITKNTKAILPVHLHGYPCDMDSINKIAKKYKLFVIEDACQAHGSIYKKKRTGSLGDIAAFSFYPSKNLGAFGDAGAITTSDKNVANKIFLLRNQGAKEKYEHEIVGYNARLDTLQASVLRLKLRELDKNNLLRKKHAYLYYSLLKHLPITLPQQSETNYHVFAIQVKQRNELLTYLKRKGIQCGIHYPLPLHLQPALSQLKYRKGDFPYAERFAQETLSLPMYPTLTSKEIRFICIQINSFFAKLIK